MTMITLVGNKKLDIKQLKPPFPAKQLQWRSTSGTVLAHLLTLSPPMMPTIFGAELSRN
jgi:hypothetical protein